ncbi:helix-turn-helix domain-containing protein [Actinomadura keratinilytica]|jgi:excisionase family DNA binding protein|uniref:HTH merR-type domain-containing protein n=1 Tax=Actinomadura keratinilytica TaxID=547461 RepID=A0ABP7YUA6_9ACTN
MRGDELPDLLTTAEVAALFRVARSTVSGWASRGLLPPVRTPSGRLRFHRADIEALLRHGLDPR